jgi:hypothetical protein
VKKQNNDKNDVVNEIVPLIGNVFMADIKVVQKKETKAIESVAKILKGKEIIWQQKNDKGKDKSKEIISIIVDMVAVAKEHNAKLSVKVNYKQFVADYNKSVLCYKELEKATMVDDNVIEVAMQENDLGMMNNVRQIIPYEPIISLRNYFEIKI